MKSTTLLLAAKRYAPQGIVRSSGSSTNPAMRFPCLDKLEEITEHLKSQKSFYNESDVADNTQRQNKDPIYGKVKSGFQVFESDRPLFLDYGGVLPSFRIAYETWGKLNKEKSNAILIHTGLSASSHAHSSDANKQPGWWEDFIGHNNSILDTSKWFLICTNVLGGCYGSTGPASFDPADGMPYASRFPMLSVQDIIRAQHRLISEHFGIDKLYASVGCSLGGMQSLCYGQQFPDNVHKIVSVSGCARSHPSSIAMRHVQRQVLMADPNWNRGFYYPTQEQPHRIPPHIGMKLAREIATVTYRSGPEWESRFGTERLDDECPPVLCPDFLIETYLDHQGEKFSLEYDANSFLYLSKTMDLFDLSQSHLVRSERKRRETQKAYESNEGHVGRSLDSHRSHAMKRRRTTSTEEARADLARGMAPLRDKEVLVVGVKSDGLMPHWQQREIYDLLGGDNNRKVKFTELAESDSLYGHDTFLLDLEHVGGSIGRFLREGA
ncbi:hypothetical protein HG537_0E00510 [Torulaspora globosa]|uniref:AB hydrolase-1 domain-containing protein n=1 Tax=Torulaspora globosa TaxID=48254 RepID=A0A7H9HSJ1_9SACH|nr:hypothetical protein HG537_0E00510 [Torulaspora sp. CBS 2947]